MANHIALTDLFRYGEKYFIVKTVVLRGGEAETIELLELGTRKLHRVAYTKAVDLIKSGTLQPWSAEYA